MATQSPATPTPRRRSRWPSLLLAVLLLVAAVAGTGWWALSTDSGVAWLLARVPGLRVVGMSGSPVGGPMRMDKLEWQRGDVRLAIDGLAWRDLRWRWRPYPGAWVGIELVEPRAQRVEIVTAKGGGSPKQRPGAITDLRLPAEVVVRGLAVDALQVNALPELREVRADLHLGAERGQRHRVSELTLLSGRAHAQARGEIATTGTLDLAVDGTVASAPEAVQPWQLTWRAAGPLARLPLDATLESPARASMSLKATVTPFSTWPLAALEARTTALDLGQLNSAWPTTRLAGHAVVQSSGLDAPVVIDVALTNALPGRWDALRLPLSGLRLSVRGRPDERHKLELTRFDAVLAGDQPAGQLQGSGRWERDRLVLQMQAAALRPSLMDARLPAATLSGPLTLDLTGVPSPADGTRPQPPRLTGEVQARLDGRLDDRPAAPPLRLSTSVALNASEDALLVDVKQLEASSGPAHATLRVRARRDAALHWRLDGRGELAGFDPAVWWPGDSPAWQRGPHALNGRWDAELALPQSAFGHALPALLAALRGQAKLQLDASQLAGVPLQGTLTLRGAAQGTQIDGTLQAADNRASFEGRATGQAGADHWQVDLQAPALSTLAPWVSLFPAAQAWTPQGGSIIGKGSADGRWPDLRSSGELHVAGIKSTAGSIEKADARWNVAGASPDAPLSVVLEGTGLARGEQRIERLQAELSGTVGAHRLRAGATSPLRPPVWADPLIGSRSASAGSSARLDIEGGWSAAREGGGQWTGRIAELLAASRAADSAPWLAARNLEATLRLGPDHGLRQASLAPGRIELLGSTGLRWTLASWQADAAPSTAQLQLDAELEPLQVAPWLAKLQPNVGWGGDLALNGRFKVRTSERFEADLTVERVSGDLTLSDESGTHALGLSDLRMAMVAQDGTWHFTQAMAGRNIGVLAGAQSLRVAPQASWPPPQTPLEGVLELQVADLDAWAPWLPPGWRLGGQMRTSASLGGRFGAPEYNGEIVGSALSLRNLLQGVDVRDGELAVTLRGPDAKVEKFQLRSGGGELKIEGGASFGASPRAQLRIAAQKFQLLGRVDRRIVASGDAALDLQREQIKLDGRFAIDEGLIDISRADAPSLDSDVVVRRGNGSPAPTEAPSDPPPLPTDQTLLRHAAVTLQVDLGEQLRLRGRGIDTQLNGQLRVTTPGGKLAVNGAIRTKAGTYTAYGEKLDIERGVLRFSGEIVNPRLDILAVRPNVNVRVGVEISGNATRPIVRLFSEPEMSDMEKLSWLVTGRGSETLGQNDTALLQSAALALLRGNDGGGDALIKNIGLDELSVRQTQTGDVKDTVVTLGKQLSARWYVGYERGVNATTGTWQLIYRVAQRFTLRAQSGAENALDVIWTWRWN